MAFRLVLAALATIFLILATSSWCKPQENGLDLDRYFEGQEYNSQERVVGGYDVSLDEHIPYQISMQYLTKDNVNRHFCGGSIISPNRILTAAHCVNGIDAKRVSVLAGVRDLNDKDGKRSQVVSYKIHENYMELVTSDIAVLSIDPPLELDGTNIDKIDVSGNEIVGGNQAVTLTGWGSVWHMGQGPFAKYPTRLQKLSYKTITNADCKQTMTQLTDTEICALERVGKGACNGDSGGPLVIANEGKLKQVGIVSYGTAICASNSPDVYTRVAMFDEWIKQAME